MYWIPYFTIFALAAGLGLWIRLENDRTIAGTATGGETPGWVYFLSTIGGNVQDPPAPIKIGFTLRDPFERLPEIETMSPGLLEVLDAIYCPVPRALEKLAHQQLEPFRHHGEWYDRDAALAWLDAFREKIAIS